MKEKSTSWLQVRIPPRLKAVFVKKAQKDGLNLSEWIIKNLSKIE